jgi:hypothetical protein
MALLKHATATSIKIFQNQNKVEQQNFTALENDFNISSYCPNF